MALKVWRFLLIILLIFLLSITGFFGYFIYTVMGLEGIPDAISARTTRFYYSNGDLLASRSIENRIEIPLTEIPIHVQEAIVAIEDERFFDHPGIDIAGLARAAYTNIRTRRISQGGSTITQQLARNLFLSHERTFNRKFQEMAYTVHLERQFSKDEILEKYLNTIYFGRGAYGIEAAALTYFNKNAQALTLAEGAFLVGIPQRPAMSTERALNRQKVILAKMLELDYISESEYRAALEEELIFSEGRTRENNLTQYFVDTVIYNELANLWSEHEETDLLYRGGLKIYTTLDSSMQKAAEQAFFDGMPESYRVDSNGISQPQGALVAMDPVNGHVKAMIGGRDFKETQYNRVTSARRSPGSAFKPLIYAAAMEQVGFTAATQLDSEPISIDIPGTTSPYEPKNFDGSFHFRPLTVREALALSDNVIAVKTNIAVGPEEAVKFANHMGIKSILDPVVSLPLGTDITALEMTTAFTPFANRGVKVEPMLVTKVEDAQGRVLLENKTEKEVVLNEGIAFIITDMLKGVLSPGGTASHLADLLDRPTAAKTGTAENFRSVYMVGYTPDLVASVYIGDDDHNYSLTSGSTGGRVAGPIWANFMREALKDLPPRDFIQPSNVITREICPETGMLANSACTLESYDEYFIAGTEPTEECGPENCSGCEVQWWWPWNPGFWRR